MKYNNLRKRSVKAVIGLSLLAPTVLGAVAPSMVGFSTPVVVAETYTATNGSVTVKPDNTGQTNGTITLNGASATQSIKNKEFMFYKIFNIENSKNGESVNYTYNAKYKKYVQEAIFAKMSKEYKKNYNVTKAADVSEYIAIDVIQGMNCDKVEGSTTTQTVASRYSAFRYFIEDLKEVLRKAKVDGDLIKITSADANNSVKIKGLSLGYYVVDEVSTKDANGTTGNVHATDDGLLNNTGDTHTGASEGTHFATSLVMVGAVNNEAVLTLKSDYPEITKKIREDDNQENIGVHKDGWNDIGDYEIGQTVPYENEVSIPNMNGYLNYYFAIEDRMDNALTFTADKSKIKLTINKKVGDEVKSYTLKDTDYNLHTIGTNVSQTVTEAKYAKNFTASKSTFGLEIEDLKALVDREFGGKSGQENDYSNLSMHVEYEAVLNDNAAEDTGRPGFENDVRLIFSNEPELQGQGEVGKTPWDTVVAFTYRLNGLKVDDKDATLEGAHFRLYEDEEMTKEIILKKKPVDETKDDSTDEPKVDADEKSDETKPSSIIKESKGDAKDDTSDKKDDSDKDGDKDDAKKDDEKEKPTPKGTNEYIVVNKDSSEGVEGVDIVSDKDGNFSIVGLDSGTYYLKEVKAPEGYKLLEQPIKLTVTATMVDDRDHYLKGDGATDNALKDFSGTAELLDIKHEKEDADKKDDADKDADKSEDKADAKKAKGDDNATKDDAADKKDDATKDDEGEDSDKTDDKADDKIVKLVADPDTGSLEITVTNEEKPKEIPVIPFIKKVIEEKIPKLPMTGLVATAGISIVGGVILVSLGGVEGLRRRKNKEKE